MVLSSAKLAAVARFWQRVDRAENTRLSEPAADWAMLQKRSANVSLFMVSLSLGCLTPDVVIGLEAWRTVANLFA